MRTEDLQELKDRNLLSDPQYSYLDDIFSRRIVSVFYELRIILYLGIMLFTTGAGILIYQNIGDLGHIVVMGILFILMASCFVHAFKFARSYDHGKIKPPTPYYDYIALLGCLLFISILTYLQFQYNLFDEGMGAATLVTSIVMFYMAYRFDHLAILSLAITALASFWSISMSPQKWYSGSFLEDGELHNTAILLGTALAATGWVLDRRGIKKHFTFTYLNFASLMYLSGCLTGIFTNSGLYLLYFLALATGCALLVYYATKAKSFLFLLYAFVAGYTGFTYVLFSFLTFEDFLFIMFYFIISCAGFIYFIIRYKSYFKRAE
jgi:hypothetical protein